MDMNAELAKEVIEPYRHNADVQRILNAML
jgi:hypothetical protein